jgi:membrane-associated phospholipid phosphatase
MAGSEDVRFPFGLTAPLGAFRLLDAIIAGYVVVVSIPLALGAARGTSGCAQQLSVNLAVLSGLALVCVLSRRSRSWLFAFLRLSYGPSLFAVLYRQTATVWPVLYEQPFDAWLVHVEQVLWGSQPSLVFAQHAPWRWLSELFCAAYYAYYYFIPAMLFTVLLTRGYTTAERVVFSTTLCFLICYTLFWLFPTVAPHYWFPPHAGPQLYQGYLFNHLLFLFTAAGEVPAGAFPSSHIAVALLLTMQASRFAPRLFPFMLAVTVVMCPAVVYLRAHYAVDVPAGILMGTFIAIIADRIPLARKSRGRQGWGRARCAGLLPAQ